MAQEIITNSSNLGLRGLKAGITKQCHHFLFGKMTKNDLSKTSIRNSGQYRSAAVERYALNTMHYLLKSIELLVLAAVNKAFKVFNEKFFARTETCVMICYS